MQSILQAGDGTPLAMEDHTLENARARVVIVHGYAEHRGRYAGVVDALTASRFECHLFDLRGHGQSGGPPGYVAKFEEYIDDLALVIEHVRAAAHDPRPMLIVAHSLGGLIALSYVHRQTSPVDALAVSSPFLRPAFEVSTGQQLLAAIATHVAPHMTLNVGFEPEWLSRDESVVAAYVNDPLVHRTTTPRWFTEVERAQRDLIAAAATIRLPILMMLGTDDRIADNGAATNVFEHLGSADKTLKRYDGLRHEIFNETSRGAVISDLTAWLTTHS